MRICAIATWFNFRSRSFYRSLCRTQCAGYQILFDGIGVYGVIDFGEFALGSPAY